MKLYPSKYFKKFVFNLLINNILANRFIKSTNYSSTKIEFKIL